MGNYKKSVQLGMHHGTASARLKKKIVFDLLKKLNQNFCFQCGSEIGSEEDLSVEHKVPWLDSENPVNLFFDLDNIAFSHLSCNIGAARKPESISHGNAGYKRGCRCDECKEWKKEENKRNR